VVRKTFVGTATAPRRSVVGSGVEGRIVSVFARAGERVETDQPLAQLQTRTLEIELVIAKAEIELRRQELKELQNGSLPEQIEQAQARVDGASARAKYAAAKLRRTQETYEKSAGVSLDEMERAVSESIASQQDLLVARAAFQLVVKGPRAERIAQAAARLAIQVASEQRIKELIGRHTLRAPFDGYIVTVHGEIGAWASQGDPVFEVTELDPIEIRVSIPESFVTKVRADSPAKVTFGAIPEKTYSGKVVQVVPQADLRSRTFPVRVQLPNPETNGRHLFKAGMFVRVTLVSNELETAHMVPKDALVLGGPREIVFVLVPDSKNSSRYVTEEKPVRLGVADGSLIQVTGKLTVGQLVVIEGNERLRPGQPVVVTP